MKELSEAIYNKRSLADKVSVRSVNEYYYNETVKVKHRTSVGPFNGEPYYTYHEELRFNSGKYSQDLGGINAQIQQYLSQINQLTSSLESLTSKNQTVAENKKEVTSSENTKKAAEDLLAQTKASLTAYIQGLTKADRASIVASEITNSDSEYLIETICELGFDYNVLAAIAIDSNNSSLLDFALHSGANLDQYLVEGKTLIQHAVKQGNNNIISKSIAATKHFETSLFYALLQNDLVSLKAILSVQPELASSLLFEDYNLAHYAIANNQMEVLSYVMSICPKALTVTNSNGDSSFKIALRSGNNEMVALVSEHVNLADEYVSLKQKGNTDLIDRAIGLDLAKAGFAAIKEDKEQLEDLLVHVGGDSSSDLAVIGNIGINEIEMI